MKAAYADPPYLGLAAKFYGGMHEAAAEYDKPETHKALIERLCDEYDAWAMSLHTPTLRTILPMCPDDVRVMAWTKTWCSFRPGNKFAHFAWEPVIVRGARPRTERLHAVRDYVTTGITGNSAKPAEIGNGFKGSKPQAFCFWLFDVLNLEANDEFFDVFSGSGAVAHAWEKWRTRSMPEQFALQG